MLLPSMCVCKQGNGYFMVLSVEADVGAILWPMTKIGEMLWFDRCEAVRLALVSDIGEWMVQPIMPVSPLHQGVVGGLRRASLATGVALAPHSSPAKVLDWHLDRSCAHMSGYVLKRLLQMEAFECAPALVEQAAQQDRPREALSMALILAMRPKISEADLTRLMHLRRSLEKREDMSMLRSLLDNDVLSVCLRQDFLKIRETVGQTEAACERFRTASSRTQPMANELRTHVRGQKVRTSRAAPSNPSQSSAPSNSGNRAQRLRFAARVSISDCDVVHDWAPGGIKIRVDELNGCFRILREGSLKKSVSWTVRGRQAAIKLCLIEAWRIHEDSGGGSCPFRDMLEA